MPVTRKNQDILDKINDLMSGAKWSETIEILRKREKAAPLDSKSYWNLAWSYFKTNDFSSSIKFFKKAITAGDKQDAKQNCLNHGFLGIVLQEDGQIPEAIRYLEKALKFHDHTMIRNALALAYREKGEPEKAEKIYLHGIELKPDNPARLEAYGHYLSDTGRKKEALAQYKDTEKAYKKAIKKSPNSTRLLEDFEEFKRLRIET